MTNPTLDYRVREFLKQAEKATSPIYEGRSTGERIATLELCAAASKGIVRDLQVEVERLRAAGRRGWFAGWLGAMWMKYTYPGELLVMPEGLAARLLEESYLVRGPGKEYTLTPEGMALVRECDPKYEVCPTARPGAV